VATPGFVQALSLLQRLQKCRPAGTAADPAEAFAKGQAVPCLADAGRIKRFPDSQAGRGKVGNCQGPGRAVTFDHAPGGPPTGPGGTRVPYLGGGGWLAVVPARAAPPDAAFDLLAELRGRGTSRKIVIEPAPWGGGGFRREHFLDAAG